MLWLSAKEMAPTVLEHTGARPIRSSLIDTTSVAYVLCRTEDDASLTPIGDHEDIVAAVTAGKHQAQTEDLDFSYALYADVVKVASFAEA